MLWGFCSPLGEVLTRASCPAHGAHGWRRAHCWRRAEPACRCVAGTGVAYCKPGPDNMSIYLKCRAKKFATLVYTAGARCETRAEPACHGSCRAGAHGQVLHGVGWPSAEGQTEAEKSLGEAYKVLVP